MGQGSSAGQAYKVKVDKRGDQKLGLGCEPSDATGAPECLVSTIADDGLISVWNNANPGSPVKAGDRVADVNGHTGFDNLHKEMAKGQMLNITFVRSHEAHQALIAQRKDASSGSTSVPREAGHAAPRKERCCIGSSSVHGLAPERLMRVEEKSKQFYALLMELETALADPDTVVRVGKAYKDLYSWTLDHHNDGDLRFVLSWLGEAADYSYPAWRRQALEEAYRLFYDEIAKQGDPVALQQLREPPTSEEIGFRKLPEALVTGAAAKVPYFSGTYEDSGGNCPLYQQQWQYEVRRLSAEGKAAHGREIVGKGQIDAPDSSGYLKSLLQAVIPADQFECCSRRDDVTRARGPLLLPEGARATAHLPTGEVTQSFQSSPLPRKPPSVAMPPAQRSPKPPMEQQPGAELVQGNSAFPWPQQRVGTDPGAHSVTGSSNLKVPSVPVISPVFDVFGSGGLDVFGSGGLSGRSRLDTGGLTARSGVSGPTDGGTEGLSFEEDASPQSTARSYYSPSPMMIPPAMPIRTGR